mgnify:CR=1 FL=1|jgi:nucleotide-binding universal stress UspA family protein
MYRTILLAYDGTTEGRLALREGARLAQICGASVVLLSVVDLAVSASMAGTATPYASPYDMDEYRRVLDEGVSRLKRMGLSPLPRLETGEPVDRIVAVAAATRADLVVVGHHQDGIIRRWLHPSVTAALTDRLPCSLLVARHEIGDAELFAAADTT